MMDWQVEEAIKRHHERVLLAEQRSRLLGYQTEARHHSQLRERAANRVGDWLVTTGKRLQMSTNEPC